MSSVGLPDVTLSQAQSAGDRDPRERQYTGAARRTAGTGAARKGALEQEPAEDLGKPEEIHELDERA